MMKSKKVMTDPSLVQHLHGHQKCVTGLSFDPQSRQLISSSHDHSLILWNLKDKTRAFKFLGHTDIVSDTCFSPTGQLIASASFDRTVMYWTPTVGGKSTVFRAHTQAVQSVHFAHDGSTLLTSSNDRSIKEWSVSSKTFLSTFTGHTNWVLSARYSHDAKTIVSVSDDKSVKLFDKQSHQCVHTFTESRVPKAAVFHPSDTYVAAALSNKCIKLYDLRVMKQLQLYQCHENNVTSVTFHPDGSYLFSSSCDGTIKIIDLLEGRTLYTLEGNMGPLTALASTCTGDYFASGGLDGQILLWKANFDEVLCKEDEGERNESILEKGLDKLKDSRIIQKFNDIDINSHNNKENLQLNANGPGVKMLHQKDNLSRVESCHEKDFKTLSEKMDALLEIVCQMKDKLVSLDERCKKLEDIHLGMA